jgi:hypothetical protein
MSLRKMALLQTLEACLFCMRSMLISGSKVKLIFEEACSDLLKEEVCKKDVGLISDETSSSALCSSSNKDMGKKKNKGQ